MVATATGEVAISQNRTWFIGRANQSLFPLEGLVSEVRVLNYARESGLIAHWTLDDTELTFSNGLADLVNDVANGPLGRIQNANSPGSNPTTGLPGATPATGTAIRLNTKFQRIETNLTQADHFGANPFTLAFWFRTEAKQDGVDVLASSDNGPSPTPQGWSLELTGAPGAAELGLRFFHRGWGGSGGTAPDRITAETSIMAGEWYHLALVRSLAETDNLTLFLNGQPLWTRTNQQIFSVDSTKGVWWGRRPDFGTSGTLGLFDDLRLYSGALPAAEIGDLAAAGVTSSWKPLPISGFAFVEPNAVPLQWRVDGQTRAEVAFTLQFGLNPEDVSPVATIPPGETLVWNVADLDYDRTYYWRVSAQTNSGLVSGPVWSFSTKPFPIPGIVIDHSPKSMGRYVGSPSIVELPHGPYIATHDWFGPGTSFNQTVVFESTDQGRSWRQIQTLTGQFWSTLFWHRNALYLMGTDGRFGRSTIRRSEDGGHTWTTPTDHSNGVLFPDSLYHTAPMPVVIHQGRIWRAMEDAQNGTQWGRRFSAFMMSAPVESDLLQAASWTSSNRLGHNGNYRDGNFGGWLEGNAVVDPSGNMVNIPRVAYYAGAEKAALIRISADGTTASFDPEADFIDFPGGAKKFVIRQDPATGRYWTLANEVLPQHAGGNIERTRNAVALMSSPDLRQWTTHSIVLYHPNVSHHGFQYLDWQFSGEDLIAVSRTAHEDGVGGANSAHDANFMTFHRFENFRQGVDDGYASWAARVFPEEPGTPGTRPNEDYSGDGLSNLHSYAFDLDPRHFNHPVPFEIKAAREEGETVLTAEFRLRADAALRYAVELSRDLTTWVAYPFGFDGNEWTLSPETSGGPVALTEISREESVARLQMAVSTGSNAQFIRLQAGN